MRAERLSPGSMTAFIVLAAVVTATLSFVIPVSSAVHNVTYAHTRIAIAAIMTVTTIGSGLLFLRGRRSFTDRLHRTYILLAIAVCVFGVAVLQIPVIAINELWGSWYVNSGLVIAPFIISTTTLYASMRTFAMILGIRSRLLSWTFAHGAAITIGLIYGITAHFLILYSLEGTDLYIGVTAFTGAYLLWAAALAIIIAKTIGPHYRQAMAALGAALAALAASGWHEATRTFLVNDGNWYVDTGAFLLPFAVSGILLVRAGYYFSKLPTNIPAMNTFGEIVADEKTAYIQGVTWTASLASKPEDIASVIDIIRLVTAEIPPDATTLTAGQKDQLLHIYETLEEYLVNQDPLKRHQRDEVRAGLNPLFRDAVQRMKMH